MRQVFLFASFYFFLVLILAWLTFYILNLDMCNCILKRKKSVKSAIKNGGVCQAELFVFWRAVGEDYHVEANAVTLNDIAVPYNRSMCKVIGDPDTGHEVIAKFRNGAMVLLIDTSDKTIFKTIKNDVGKFALIWFIILGGITLCYIMLQKHGLVNNMMSNVMFSLLHL